MSAQRRMRTVLEQKRPPELRGDPLGGVRGLRNALAFSLVLWAGIVALGWYVA